MDGGVVGTSVGREGKRGLVCKMNTKFRIKF